MERVARQVAQAVESLTSSHKKADVGVLFVHGIGQQKRGQTLLQGGAGVIDWLRNWLPGPAGSNADPEGGPVHILESYVEAAPPSDGSAPAFVRIEIEAPQGKSGSEGSTASSEWVLAESRWADAFYAPTFSSFALWAFAVLPWSIFASFNDRVRGIATGRRARGLDAQTMLRRTTHPVGVIARFPRMAVNVLLYGALIPVTLLVQLAVVALLPLQLIPRLRSTVASIQAGLTRIVGDTQVLLNNDVSFQAMAQQVANDLIWMCGRVDRVVIVAHSQGAAVSHRALEIAEPSDLRKVERWVTYGTAMGRYDAMQFVDKATPAAYWGTASALLGLTILGGAFIMQLSGWVADWGGPSQAPRVLFWAIGWLALSFLLALVGLAVPVTMHGILDASDDRYQLSGVSRQFEWLDLYATADPAPNGPILDPACPGPFAPDGRRALKRIEVVNGDFVVTDHVSYWRNIDEFVSVIVDVIKGVLPARSSSAIVASRIAPPRLDAMAKARRRRVGWSVAHRSVAAGWLFVVGTACLGFKWLASGGGKPGVESAFLHSLLSPLPKWAEDWLASQLFVRPIDCPENCRLYATSGDLWWALLIILILGTVFVVYRTVSKGPANRSLRDGGAAAHAPPRTGPTALVTLYGAVGLLLVGGLPLVTTWLWHDRPLRLDEFSAPGLVWLVAISLVVIVSIWLGFTGAGASRETDEHDRFASGFWDLTRPDWRKGIVGLVLMLLAGSLLLWAMQGPGLGHRVSALGRATSPLCMPTKTLTNRPGCPAIGTELLHSGYPMFPHGWGLFVVFIVFVGLTFSLLGAIAAGAHPVQRSFGFVGALLAPLALLPTGGVILRFVLAGVCLLSLLAAVLLFARTEEVMKSRLGKWRIPPKRIR